MGRFTEKDESICNYCEYERNNGCIKTDPAKCVFNITWNKLKHYEDLEEAGRLTEQPCKPGDKVWCIEEDDYAGYLFMGMCGDYAIVCSTYTWCEDFDHQLETMAEETIEDGETHVEAFHKSNVFLTKAEAEAKLAELEECDNQ